MRPLTPTLRRLTALVILVFTTGAMPEPLTLSGTVTDADTGRPLESAQVYVPALGIGVLTDDQGRYELKIPDHRAHSPIRVRVELIGYSVATAVADPGEDRTDSTVTLNFALERTALALQELIVGPPGTRPAPVSADAARSIAPMEFRSTAGHGQPGYPPTDREQYAHIDENDFRSADDHPLSTFSIDVDRASYSNVRRFLLREDRLPPIDAVQIEEMVNYFTYDYALPRDGRPLAVTDEVGPAPWNDEHLLLRIGLASPPIEAAELPPSNLVFLLDVSGSMRSPDKLPLVKRSLRLLVNQLREEDRVAIVVYAGAAGLVLEPTSGADKERILDAIDRMEAGGSTAGGAGLRLAYSVARRHFVRGGNNRVILATDGDFNVGESSDGAMTRLIEEKRREGTALTVLGFGRGNLQSAKMQALAQHGNGNWAYIDGLDEARKVLVNEMGGTLVTVAKDVKIQMEFNPRLVRSYRLIGYENRLLADEDFNDDEKDAGDLGAGHTVTALYEIVPVWSDSEVDTPGIDPLRYRTNPVTADPSSGGEVAFLKVRYKEPNGTESRLIEQPIRTRVDSPSGDFRFASAVAGFGMILRESEHSGSLTTDQVLALAWSGLGPDPDGYRRGFLELVEAYRRILRVTDRELVRR